MSQFDELVEATMLSIHFDCPGRTITCCFRQAVTGTHFDLIVEGVVDMIWNEVRMSNIVDEVAVYSGPQCDKPEVTDRLTQIFLGSERDAGIVPPLLNEQWKAIREGALMILELVPIYGATALMLAKSVKLKRH